jgi:hypothetical protein
MVRWASPGGTTLALTAVVCSCSPHPTCDVTPYRSARPVEVLHQRVGPGQIASRLIDATSGLPIRDARIVVRSMNRSEPPDSAGFASIAGLPVGRYEVTAVGIGYLSAADSVVIGPDSGHGSCFGSTQPSPASTRLVSSIPARAVLRYRAPSRQWRNAKTRRKNTRVSPGLTSAYCCRGPGPAAEAQAVRWRMTSDPRVLLAVLRPTGYPTAYRPTG